ncbi:unnamed protein product [Rhizophagus irregularis]|nr:unnamed protein product [Rhizophagus irregularis]
MTSVTLNCLVIGEDPYTKCFSVDISTGRNINTLKKVINDDLISGVATKDLKLFQVDVPLGKTRDENVVARLKSGDLNIGLEMYNNLQQISDYFSAQPPITNLHILVQLPTVAIEQPGAGSKRIC